MKKYKLLFSLIVPFLITACSSGGHFNSRNNPIASLFGQGDGGEASLQGASFISGSRDENVPPIYEHIDVDLTTMSSTMVYSEVSNMMYYPSRYKDKVVKATGPFVIGTSSIPDYCYPAVLIQDATACCANGLEFLLYGIPRCTSKGGDGYPTPNEQVTVVGRFKTYLEGSSMYVHLVDALWLK